MTDVTKQFTKNPFIDRCLKIIPDDPLTQSQYMYYLTVVVFLGLAGYAITSWYTFFTTWKMSSFFSGMFMIAIALLSSFGLKQTRSNYLMVKEAVKQLKIDKEPKIESPEDMLKSFKNEK